MKNLTQEVMNDLQNNHFDFVKCFIIKLKNNEFMYFTENSNDIIIDGNIYKSSFGIENEEINSFNDITESNCELTGFLTSDLINEEDILRGKFNNAEIEIFLINKDKIDKGKIKLSKGFFKEINFINGKFVVKIEGLLSLLQKNIVKTFSPMCRASFCDSKCSLNISKYTHYGKITTINSELNFFSKDLLNFENNFFKYGLITFKTGLNKDYFMDIKDFVNSNIILNNKMSFELKVNDEFEIFEGCDKIIETCYNKFKNSINFRGEPQLPRTTKIYKFY